MSIKSDLELVASELDAKSAELTAQADALIASAAILSGGALSAKTQADRVRVLAGQIGVVDQLADQLSAAL